MPSLRSTLERIRVRFDPPPGGFQRLVSRRRRRERNQRLAAGALALALSGSVLAGLFWTFPRADTPRPGGSPTPGAQETPEPSGDPTPTPESDDGADRIIPGAFYPTTYREGDQIVMPTTFMDGSTAEVLFAAGLRPGRLGAYGFIAGGLGRVDRSINSRHGDASSFKGSGPLATYEGRGGTTVEEWEPPPDSFGCPNLVFRFGDWFVGVRTCQRELSEQEKAEWARRLSGRQTRNGFLVLEAEAPLTIAETGTHDGPQLLLQGPEGGWPFITLTPLPCDPERPPDNEDVRTMDDGQRVGFSRGGGTSYADWCEDGAMFIQVESTDPGYVEAAAQGLRVRNVSLSESG